MGVGGHQEMREENRKKERRGQKRHTGVRRDTHEIRRIQGLLQKKNRRRETSHVCP